MRKRRLLKKKKRSARRDQVGGRKLILHPRKERKKQEETGKSTESPASFLLTQDSCLSESPKQARAVLVVVVIVEVNFELGQHLVATPPVTCPLPASAFCCSDNFYLYLCFNCCMFYSGGTDRVIAETFSSFYTFFFGEVMCLLLAVSVRRGASAFRCPALQLCT